MIQWYEGLVTRIKRPEPGEDKVITLSAISMAEGYHIDNIQLPIKSGFQELVTEGSKILFYRDSLSTAKFALLLSDSMPISSPISFDTAEQALSSGTDFFEPGEVAISALGHPDDLIPSSGGQIWLKNTGDAVIYSGTQLQRVSVSDSTDSVDICGTNIDISATGNILATHSFNIDTNDVGVTSSRWGIRNPMTGTFTSRIGIDVFGGITLGLEGLTPFTVTTGLSYQPLPSQVKLTAIPSTSEITVGLTGTDIVGPSFGVTASTMTLTGSTTAQGSVTINGPTTLTGSVSLMGLGPVTSNGLPGATGVFPVRPGALITISNGLVISVT